jgi:hypothetical protein
LRESTSASAHKPQPSNRKNDVEYKTVVDQEPSLTHSRAIGDSKFCQLHLKYISFDMLGLRAEKLLLEAIGQPHENLITIVCLLREGNN